MKQEVKDLKQKIKDIQQQSEVIANHIGSSYPQILSDLENKLSRSAMLLNQLSVLSTDEGSLDDSELGSKLGMTRDLIDESSYFLSQNAEKHTVLISKLDKEIGGIKKIDHSIQTLKDVSIDMEIISINTLTVAIKAGKAGGAFSYITSEIRKLTSRMISLADDLAEKGSRIQSTLETYQSTITQGIAIQEKLISNLNQDISRSFDTFFMETQVVVHILETLVESARKIKVPILKTMETLQFQDILRQSLDHVLIFLDEDEKLTNTKDLDTASFCKNAVVLCIELIKDINDRFKGIIDIFQENHSNLNSTFKEIMDSTKNFEEHFKSNSSGKSAFGETFKHATSIVDNVVTELSGSSQKKSDIFKMSKELGGVVGSLEQDLEQIGSLVDRFQNINVASRIEVARQRALSEMAKNIEEMTGVIENIQINVGNALNMTKDFITGAREIVDDLNLQSKEENEYVQGFSSQLKRLYNDVYEEGYKLQQSITGFSLAQKGFLDSFRSLDQDLVALVDLGKALISLENDFIELKDVCEVNYYDTLKDNNLTSWTVKNDHMKELLNRFTIFTHKQAGSRIVGVDLDESSADSGEVTLF